MIVYNLMNCDPYAKGTVQFNSPIKYIYLMVFDDLEPQAA